MCAPVIVCCTIGVGGVACVSKGEVMKTTTTTTWDDDDRSIRCATDRTTGGLNALFLLHPSHPSPFANPGAASGPSQAFESIDFDRIEGVGDRWGRAGGRRKGKDLARARVVCDQKWASIISCRLASLLFGGPPPPAWLASRRALHFPSFFPWPYPREVDEPNKRKEMLPTPVCVPSIGAC